MRSKLTPAEGIPACAVLSGRGSDSPVVVAAPLETVRHQQSLEPARTPIRLVVRCLRANDDAHLHDRRSRGTGSRIHPRHSGGAAGVPARERRQGSRTGGRKGQPDRGSHLKSRLKRQERTDVLPTTLVVAIVAVYVGFLFRTPSTRVEPAAISCPPRSEAPPGYSDANEAASHLEGPRPCGRPQEGWLHFGNRRRETTGPFWNTLRGSHSIRVTGIPQSGHS